MSTKQGPTMQSPTDDLYSIAELLRERDRLDERHKAIISEIDERLARLASVVTKDTIVKTVHSIDTWVALEVVDKDEIGNVHLHAHLVVPTLCYRLNYPIAEVDQDVVVAAGAAERARAYLEEDVPCVDSVG